MKNYSFKIHIIFVTETFSTTTIFLLAAFLWICLKSQLDLYNLNSLGPLHEKAHLISITLQNIGAVNSKTDYLIFDLDAWLDHDICLFNIFYFDCSC